MNTEWRENRDGTAESSGGESSSSTDVENRKVSVSGDEVCSKELLGDARHVTIIHRDEEYRLTLTSKGKLILTK